MRTVASKLSELSSKLRIFVSEGCFPSSTLLRSEGESEKKAISEADAKPDANKSIPAEIIAITAVKDGGLTVIPLNISVN